VSPSTLRFTEVDMAAFADASADRSPIHTDPAFARRTAFGEPIVYGGLETIAMLGALPADAQARVRRVRSLFGGPVLPGSVCELRSRSRAGEWEVRLDGRGRQLARLLTDEGAEVWTAAAPSGETEAEWRPGDGLAELAERFGAGQVDPRLLAGIAWASRVVGAEIPDFHGLCTGVSVALGPGGEPVRGRLSVGDPDPRTDRIVIETRLLDAAGLSACGGVVECVPFAPVPLERTASLEGRVPPPATPGTAVVLGGSRGLGGALALELLARGQLVHVVYSRSDAAAAELARFAGPSGDRLRLHRADARDPAAMANLAAAIGGEIDGCVCCAAEPALSMGLAPELADHVGRAVELAATPLVALLPLLRPGGWVMFCSSLEVDEPAREHPQFAVAKAALEGLARWVALTRPQSTVFIARLPRMRTDAVNSPSARQSAAEPETIAASLAERALRGDESPGVAVVDLSVAVGAVS
jgi:NAD(P)-dependent dehydrogenase (short-subunit alcohol dehydrogenase family)/acyl dehydratase